MLNDELESEVLQKEVKVFRKNLADLRRGKKDKGFFCLRGTGPWPGTKRKRSVPSERQSYARTQRKKARQKGVPQQEKANAGWGGIPCKPFSLKKNSARCLER